jgi:hypothetical protein
VACDVTDVDVGRVTARGIISGGEHQ